ncbi:CRISPR-associated endonuclease Cas1 [Corynebacterium sp. NML180780]|uniref:CRISPR-associated endonuclease Cas1 n=1 Tax=Corynebacterium sp. NML180780 TaxID=2598459 RepID=UPI001193A8D4|nr:CRISPR-associated endonuclease Cas1 [Corynebacterium sp. NML180780]TVX77541.1 CRISPR-associated endonuclease Cas1 [Corynebacterium sp. NML180780]
MTREEDFLPISLVLHTVFCERRAWLEANGESTLTYQMQAGDNAHEAVDTVAHSRTHRLTSYPLRSERLGIVGKADVVEVFEGNEVGLVEHKATPVRRKAQVTPANRLQLALQRECLRDAGFDVIEQTIYFTDHRRRVVVELTDDDSQAAAETIARTREIVDSAIAPVPLLDDERCSRCSHFSICLPDEHHGGNARRRIHAADPDGQVLHLTVQGSRASIRRGRVIVEKSGERLADAPLARVHGVVVHGNIDLSSALHRNLLWDNVPVVWCSSTGRVYGFSKPADGPNGAARVEQHVLSSRGCLPIARGMVQAKIWNQATLLRRNGEAPDAVRYLHAEAERAAKAADIPELFGIEGDAAARYFHEFVSMLRPAQMEALGWQWEGRHGRGASDPLNILLNYCYGLLRAEVLRAILSCGLDPHAGFLHSSGRNKPALALDLMEEFRAPLADSVVLSLVNRREIKTSDFTYVNGAARLRDKARRKVIAAFERRVQTSIRHPLFGYDATWRRVIEIQARMVLGVITGSQPYYEGVKIR